MSLEVCAQEGSGQKIIHCRSQECSYSQQLSNISYTKESYSLYVFFPINGLYGVVRNYCFLAVGQIPSYYSKYVYEEEFRWFLTSGVLRSCSMAQVTASILNLPMLSILRRRRFIALTVTSVRPFDCELLMTSGALCPMCA